MSPNYSENLVRTLQQLGFDEDDEQKGLELDPLELAKLRVCVGKMVVGATGHDHIAFPVETKEGDELASILSMLGTESQFDQGKKLVFNDVCKKGYINLLHHTHDLANKAKIIWRFLEGNSENLEENILSRLIVALDNIIAELLEEIGYDFENIFTIAAHEGRKVDDADLKLIEKLSIYRRKCIALRTQVHGLVDAQQIIHREGLRRISRGGYVMTEDRRSLMFGNDRGTDNSIMSALRAGARVELVGPTGTGKTTLAISAAKLFSGKEPVLVSGNAHTGAHDFLGSASDLGKRNDGALIACLRRGQVLIVDEDNRIDPRVLAIVKRALSLKPGQIFTHPETQEEFVVPATFGIIVTRNEAGAHHRDRHLLPPDYRREFAHGSFEVRYYDASDVYENLLLPQLMNHDGSISLSMAAIGGEIDTKNGGALKNSSPLLSLVYVIKEVESLYLSNVISDGVMETGWITKLFASWSESKVRANCSLRSFIEQKLIEFIRRPIGNAARRKIIEVCIKFGFFESKTFEYFNSQNDGSPFSGTDDVAKGNDYRRMFAAKAVSFVSDADANGKLDLSAVGQIDIWGRRPASKVSTVNLLAKDCLDGINELLNKLGLRPVTFNPRGKTLSEWITYLNLPQFGKVFTPIHLINFSRSPTLDVLLQKVKDAVMNKLTNLQ